MTLNRSPLTEEQKATIDEEIEIMPKLPCGHFIGNAVGFGLLDWGPDFVCHACIMEGKTLREAFEVCARFCEDHRQPDMATAIRAFTKEPEEIAIRRSAIRSKPGDQDYGEDATLAFLANETSGDSVAFENFDLRKVAEEVERETGLHPDALEGDERELARGYETPDKPEPDPGAG